MSNKLLPDEMYCNRYKEIKNAFGKSIASAWTEKTDPSKFVYEDCGIVAYLLELLQSYGIGPSKQFADLGCGNGLLVFLLSCHGFRGLGLDVRERNIWEQFRMQGADLRETKFDPSSRDSVEEHLKGVDFLIGNHSDELTPWIPVIAARLRCNFFLLPCCTYDFFGKYSKKMPSEKALAAGAPKGIAEQHFAYIEHICHQLGFKVEIDQLKIPSRKRKCLVGVVPADGLGSSERIEAAINGLLSLAKIGTKDIFTPRPSKEQVRNCSKLPFEYRMDLVKRIVNCLIEITPGENIDGWRCGGSISLQLLAQKLLTADDRRMLANQDKGLQTFLRNQHQIFCVIKGIVSMRKWSIVNEEFARKSGGKPPRSHCFFHRLHPDGCPLEAHILKMNSHHKILFLGDSSVGKTSLVNSLCGIGSPPQSTLSCTVQIFPHQFQAGTPNEATELLEFWDVGGSNSHRKASAVFMDGADGVVLVHDLNNVRSEQNLALWVDLLYAQITRHRRHGLNSSRLVSSPNLSMSDASSIVSPERSFDGGSGERFIALDMDRVYTIPILIVGTGADQRGSTRARGLSQLLRSYEHISLDARKPIAPGTTNRMVLCTFFDQVVRHAAVRGGASTAKLGGSDAIGMAGTPRHRLNVPPIG
ncbi:hypothetical protein niasHT_033089 [Heterodera trifolii]|uniref:tRNA (uracil-O(2)-)-methyltransferase n=1 Tax=Heterodera trifolii TaxID=157864 RepID=A0ABD2J776_9BILA